MGNGANAINHMKHAEEFVNEVGYTPLNKNIYQNNIEVFESPGQEDWYVILCILKDHLDILQK